MIQLKAVNANKTMQNTVKNFISKSLEVVRGKVALAENKIFVDKLVSKDFQEAVIKKGKLNIDEKIEEPLGTKVALINIDKGFTWLLNAVGNVRGEIGLAGSTLGDFGLFNLFESIAILDGDYGTTPLMKTVKEEKSAQWRW